MFKQHRLSKLTLAVGLGLFVHTNGLIAAEAELAANDEIEEVVAVGTRLQGSAAAVVEERKIRHSLLIFSEPSNYHVLATVTLPQRFVV